MADHSPGPGIAIVGMGEVGCCLAAALVEGEGAGRQLEFCDPQPGHAADALARGLGQPIHASPGPWLGHCGVVISAVAGDVAEQVADAVAPTLSAGTWYIDMTTAPPERLAAHADRLGARGVVVTDAAIMGAIALTRAGTPLLLSGPAAVPVAAWLTKRGFRCMTLPRSEVGDASALKLVRSIFTKGLEALAVECLLAAERRGLRGNLVEQLAVMDETPIADYLDVLVTSHVVHARRRLSEVEAARAEMIALGLAPLVLDGVLRRFRRTVAMLDRHPPDADAGHDPVAALGWLRESASPDGAAADLTRQSGEETT